MDSKNTKDIISRNAQSDTALDNYATRAFRDMNQFMKRWYDEDMDGFFTGLSFPSFASTVSNPSSSTYDNEDGSRDVVYEIPRVTNDEITVTSPSDGIVTVSIKDNQKDEQYERHTSYNNTFAVDKKRFNVDDMTVTHKNGVLRLHIPRNEQKDEDQQPKTFRIES